MNSIVENVNERILREVHNNKIKIVAFKYWKYGWRFFFLYSPVTSDTTTIILSYKEKISL